MVDFRSLLDKPAGEAEKPKPLPAGDYPATIMSWLTDNKNKKQTPYVRFTFKVNGLPEDASPEDFQRADGTPMDLSKLKFSRDYYLTDDALWRLDKLLEDLGIETSNRSYGETIPETVGMEVMIEIQQQMNQETDQVYNQVGKVWVPA